MIELTRLNGTQMVLNSDLIKTAESSPDTMLTLINGEKMIVREPCEEVVERVVAYRARLLSLVAKRLSNGAELPRVSGLTSLDVTGQSSAPPTRRDRTSMAGATFSSAVLKTPSGSLLALVSIMSKAP